jgi:hypothetical protein
VTWAAAPVSAAPVDATRASSGALSLAAPVLGALGLGQAGAVVAYTPTFYRLDVASNQWRFDTVPFIASMYVVLVLGLVGVAVGGAAVRRK